MKQPKTIKPQQKVVQKTQTKNMPTIQSKKSKARAGEIWTVNNKEIKGHKSQILRRKKNGKVEVAMITHSNKYGNIKLQENPQPNDKKNAYVVKHKKRTTVQKLGKKHPEMKIKNKTDKSVLRKIKKQK